MRDQVSLRNQTAQAGEVSEVSMVSALLQVQNHSPVVMLSTGKDFLINVSTCQANFGFFDFHSRCHSGCNQSCYACIDLVNSHMQKQK